MPRESIGRKKERAAKIRRVLGRLYPEASCALHFRDPYQLLVATVLSAQCTDQRVNMVTPALFEEAPGVEALARLPQRRLEEIIHSTGFFRNKAKNLRAAARVILAEHGGRVPGSMDELSALPGVGRKTANVILGNAFGVPGLPVDTHVGRLARRLGLSRETDPVKVERDLCALLDPKHWTLFSHQLIQHGRQVCAARKPLCDRCGLAKRCPSAGKV